LLNGFLDALDQLVLHISSDSLFSIPPPNSDIKAANMILDGKSEPRSHPFESVLVVLSRTERSLTHNLFASRSAFVITGGLGSIGGATAAQIVAKGGNAIVSTRSPLVPLSHPILDSLIVSYRTGSHMPDSERVI
jgi:hypothetical protein